MNADPTRERRRSLLASVVRAPWRALAWCFRSRYRVIVLTLLIFGLLAGGAYEGYHYWSSPSFCHSCHVMEPYYKSWATSSHKDVLCVDCHFKPGIGQELHGKWVAIKQLASTLAGSYSSMPYAEVSDASCMRSGCHTRDELDRAVEFSDRKIEFDHSAHLGEMRRGIKLACTSCHNQRFRDTHLEVDRSTCFLCHFKGAESPGNGSIGDCDTCHGPPEEHREIAGLEVVHADFVQRGMKCSQCHVELRSGSGSVGKARCFSCHNTREQLDQYDDVGLLHVEHVTKHKLHCYQCHSLIEHRFQGHSPDTPYQDCSSCHQESHSPQASMYAGMGAKGVPALPDPMHAFGLDCVGCHGDLHASRADRDRDGAALAHGQPAKSCAGCHGERYVEFVASIGKSFGEISAHLTGRLQAVQSELEKLNGSGRLLEPDTYRAATSANSNLAFVGKAHPIHNPLYAIAILRSVDESLSLVEDELELAVDDDDRPFGLEPQDCGVCHDNLPEPGDLMLDGGRPFPHPIHVEETGMDCAECHAGDRHPPRAPTAESNCKLCHQK